MTDVEEWEQKQDELGLVTVRITQEAFERSKKRVEAGDWDRTSFAISRVGTETELKVIAADRWGEKGDVLVKPAVGEGCTMLVTLNVPRHASFVKGSWRKVYRPGSFYAGGTGSPMGAVTKGISSGRAFRGRG